jgi:hypothetical protein
MITREMIEERKAEMVRNRQKAIASVSAFNGAIEDCDFWLETLNPQSPAVFTLQNKEGENTP